MLKLQLDLTYLELELELDLRLKKFHKHHPGDQGDTETAQINLICI